MDSGRQLAQQPGQLGIARQLLLRCRTSSGFFQERFGKAVLATQPGDRLLLANLDGL
jgi:hypothetical protein